MSQPDPTKAFFDTIDQELAFARVLNAPVVATYWLLGANVLIFFGMYIYGAFLDEAFSTAYYGLNQIPAFTGMKVDALIDTQPWRLVSSMFVHLNIMHIGFNGYGIFVLGPLLERFYGIRRTFVIYMIAGLVGAWASYAFNDIPSGGASGAIYGLVGALAVFGFKFRRELPPRVSRAFTTGMAPWIIIGIGIGFFDAIPFDNAAHIGGLLGGAGATVFMMSRLETRRFAAGQWFVNLLTIAFLALIVWTAAEWSFEVTNCLPSRPAFLQCYPDMADKI